MTTSILFDKSGKKINRYFQCSFLLKENCVRLATFRWWIYLFIVFDYFFFSILSFVFMFFGCQYEKNI